DAGFAAGAGFAAFAGAGFAAAFAGAAFAFGAAFAAFDVEPFRGVMRVRPPKAALVAPASEGDLIQTRHHARDEAIEPRRGLGRHREDLRDVHRLEGIGQAEVGDDG